MDVKQFCQPSVRDAFGAIRENLSVDALVLGSKLVRAAGWRGWMGERQVQVSAASPALAAVGQPVVTERRRTDTGGRQDGLVVPLAASA